jgi:hypothetical protein
MKAEERHRLHENELHRLTEHARERTRPFFDQYGTTLLMALAGLLVVIAAVVWYYKSYNANRGAGWGELAAALRKPNASAEDFANVVVNNPDTKAARWAKLLEAENYLSSGIESLYVDKDGAARDLGDARKAFEEVLNGKGAPPELTARALYGLARTLEATSDGDLKPAIEQYTRITEEYPDTAYAKVAKERVEALKSPDASAFYAWFSKQKPTPQDPLRRPQDRGPGTNPFAPQTGATGAAPPAGGPALGGSTETPSAPAEAPKPAGAAAGGTAESPANSGQTGSNETPAPPAGSTTPPAGETPAAPQ